jgi:hypothetical protein
MSEGNPPRLPEEPDNRPRLDYQSTGVGQSLEERAQIRRRFFAGMILGTVISGMVWPAGFNLMANRGLGLAMFIVPFAKIVAITVALGRREWRSFGLGLLVSIAVGFLIFFGACASNLKL